MKKEFMVSWVMCVHEFQDFLVPAIESCLNQTFSDFELVIVVNGEQSEYLFNRLRDLYSKNPKVILVKSDFKYLNENLNIGIQHSSGKYIARMDSDDISFKNRLEVQVNYLNNNQSVGLVASNYEDFSDNGFEKNDNRTHLKKVVLRDLIFRNPICHPTVMFRKSVLLDLGGYLGGLYAEDYDLWVRILLQKKWDIVILGDILLKYNIGNGGLARRSKTAYANMCATQFRSFLLTGNFKWFLGGVASGFKAVLLSNKD
jgi:glycosyltransferase involved in cell wall biosynthesis